MKGKGKEKQRWDRWMQKKTFLSRSEKEIKNKMDKMTS